MGETNLDGSFAPRDLVWLKESAFNTKRFERYPWLHIIGRCVGMVDRITASGTAAWVIWPSHHEWHWFNFEDLEPYKPREPKYRVGDHVTINPTVMEEVYRACDPNAEGVGVIVEVRPDDIQQYSISFSPAHVFRFQEAELIRVLIS